MLFSYYCSMHRFKSVIFDFDGTLIDSEIFHFHIWNEILAPYGIKLSLKFYMDKFAGVPTPMNAAYLVEAHRLDISGEALLARRERLAVEKLQTAEIKMMPYAAEMLDFFLMKEIPMGLATGSPREDVDIIFRRKKLEKYFRITVTRDDVKRSKPDPESYNICASHLGFAKTEYLAFEDTPNGVRSAKATGLTCFAIQSDRKVHDRLREADMIFEDLEAARNYLLREKLI